MKAAGIVRQLDDLGRLVLPKSLRRRMGIEPGTRLAFGLTEHGDIVLQVADSTAHEELLHAVTYALNAVEEHLMGAAIDWEDVRDVLQRALNAGGGGRARR